MNYFVLISQDKEKGFSLIELVVVVSVLSVLSAIAIPAFNCFRRRAISTAAQVTIKQIKTECETNSQDGINTFLPRTLNSYLISANQNYECKGETIALIPDSNLYPTYFYSFDSGQTSYNFKGKTGTSFVECNKLICETSVNNDKYPQEYIMKNSYFTRGCSDYVVVEGPKWADAQANAIKLGGNLVTINDADESDWIQNTYRQIGENLERDRWGARQLFIGLTRKYETGEKITNRGGYQDGWISGSKSTWRPDYWGKRNGGEGGEHDGNSSSIAFGQCGVHEDCWANWNDFPEYRHDAKGLVEIPICDQ